MSTVDTLLVRIDADLSSLKRELDKAAAATSDASKKMAGSAKSAEAGFLSLGKVIAGLATIATARALISIGEAALKAAGDIKDMASQIGLSTDSFQELIFAGAQFGLNQEAMSASLAIFSRNIGQAANGSDTMIKSFNDLGVGILDANKNLRSNNDILDDVVEKIAAMPDAAKQAAAGAELFGRGFAKLLPMFREGKIGLDALRQSAHDVGAVLSKEDAEAADAASDKFTALGRTFDVLTQKIMAGLSPALGRLADDLRILMGGGNDQDAINAVTSRITTLTSRLSKENTASMVGKRLVEDLAKAKQELADMQRMAGIDRADKISGADTRDIVSSSSSTKTSNPQGDKVRAIMEELELRKQLANVQMDWTLKTDEAIAARDREIAKIEAHNAGIKAGLADYPAELAKYESITMAIYDNVAAQKKMTDAQRVWDDMDKKAIEDAKKATEELNKRRQAKEDAIRTGELEADQSDLLVAALRIGTKEYEQQRIELELLNKAKKSGLDLSDEDIARIKTVAKRTGENTDEMKRLNDQYEEGKRAATDFTNVIGKGMEDAIVGGKGLRSVFQGMAEDILRIILRLQVTIPLQQAMMSMMGYNSNGTPATGGGGGGGGFGGILSGLFGGGGGGDMFSVGGALDTSTSGFGNFLAGGSGDIAGSFVGYASGGEPPMGKASMVGENGPELFVPKTPGTIISNDNMKGMGGGTYYIDARGADRSGIEQLQKAIKELNGSIERRSVNAVMDHKRRNPAGFAA